MGTFPMLKIANKEQSTRFLWSGRRNRERRNKGMCVCVREKGNGTGRERERRVEQKKTESQGMIRCGMHTPKVDPLGDSRLGLECYEMSNFLSENF